MRTPGHQPEVVSPSSESERRGQLTISSNRRLKAAFILRDLPDETTLEIETQNRSYILVNRGQGQASDFRPSGVLSRARAGENRRLQLGWLHAEGVLSSAAACTSNSAILEYQRPIITSRIMEIRHKC